MGSLLPVVAVPSDLADGRCGSQRGTYCSSSEAANAAREEVALIQLPKPFAAKVEAQGEPLQAEVSNVLHENALRTAIDDTDEKAFIASRSHCPIEGEEKRMMLDGLNGWKRKGSGDERYAQRGSVERREGHDQTGRYRYRSRSVVSGYMGKVLVASLRTVETVVASVDTRRAHEERNVPIRGAGGKNGDVIGAGRAWVDLRTKAQLFSEFTQKVAKRSPDQIVVLLDDDVIYGGCSDAELLRDYDLITKATGAKVVMGAEYGAYPRVQLATLHGNSTFENKRQAQLNAHHLPLNPYAAHADCPPNLPKRCECGPCSSPPRYQHINSGFYMGPARLLLPVLESAGTGAHVCDQVNTYNHLVQHPEDLTLDYTGKLVLTLARFKLDIVGKLLQVRNSTDSRVGKLVHNTVTQQTQCFMHGDGVWGAKGIVKDLAERLATTAPSDETTPTAKTAPTAETLPEWPLR